MLPTCKRKLLYEGGKAALTHRAENVLAYAAWYILSNVQLRVPAVLTQALMSQDTACSYDSHKSHLLRNFMHKVVQA